jgi:hypothetical protein
MTLVRLDARQADHMVRRSPATAVVASSAGAVITRAAVVVVVAMLAACGSAQGKRARTSSQSSPVPASVAGAPAPPAAVQLCGSATAETLARAVGQVASRIYANELSSSEVIHDKSQVEGFSPLLSAVASGNRAATKEAVTSLVFSHTHVVRLRVTRGGEVLADVGGPDILAPVSGRLRRGGRTVGHYVLSVQDDLGYVKLVTRFIGVPLVLRAGSRTLPVAGALSPGPANVPAHGPVTYRNIRYEAFSFNAQVFPSGPLRISLLVPVPAALSRRTCSEIKVAELGDVARRISRRFVLSAANFSSYIKATGPLTGGLIYIRSGSRQLAGSTHPVPRSLPNRGTVSYRGATYAVFSFTATSEVGQVRIYQLVQL